MDAKKKNRKKRDLSQMSVEDFMTSGLNESSSETASIGGLSEDGGRAKNTKKKKTMKKKKEMKKVCGNDMKGAASQQNKTSFEKTNGKVTKTDTVQRQKQIVKSAEKVAKKMKSTDKAAVKPGKTPSKSIGKTDKKELKVSTIQQHKKSLEKLKEKDPDFYKFLQNEDQELLDFNDSESESDEEAVSSDEEGGGGSGGEAMDSESSEDGDELIQRLVAQSDDDSDEEMYHKPSGELEVASDSEEEQPAARKTSSGKKTFVNMTMLKEWAKSMKKQNSISAMHKLIQAFKACLLQAKNERSDMCQYIVDDSKVFNAVVRLCLSSILPTLQALLELPPSKDARNPTLPSVSPRWNRLKPEVMAYLKNMVKMTGQMSEATIINVLLRHIHRMIPYVLCFPKILSNLTKLLINIWCQGEESSRVIAFITIMKLVTIRQETLLEPCMKKMYMAYVKNCKFTSPTSLPMINFMQRCLVELYAIDINLSYQYTFVYIRQLAIHLRNAMTMRKKGTCQAVYNWQYIHSIGLWVKLLSTLHPNEAMDSLIYPLTQVIIGTVKLVPTARYYPLRFHCVRAMTTLSGSTGTYIPVLPFILEVLEQTDFNKKHKSSSFKPFNFACILKFSKAQLEEKAFKDGLIEQVYDALLEQLHIHAHTVGFPELTVPAVVQIKDFIKKCKVANFTKQLKQLLDKVDETSKVIIQRRQCSTLDMKNLKGVDAWEKRSKSEGTPLSKYYTTWRKLRDRELMHEIAGKERIVGDDHLPTIERPDKIKKASQDERKEFSELFESDSGDSDDDDDDDNTRFLLKSERPKKKQKPSPQEDSDSQEYSDFDSDELEQLARSASEGSSNEEESEEGSSEEGSEDDDDDDDDAPDQEDLVEDFKFSDDED